MSLDAAQHTRGESVFTDDLPEPARCTFGALFVSPTAHGKLLSVDVSAAANAAGVVRVFQAEDVPAENQIGAIIPDEPLFAEGELHHVGQPIALIIAGDSGASARRTRPCAHRVRRARGRHLPA